MIKSSSRLLLKTIRNMNKRITKANLILSSHLRKISNTIGKIMKNTNNVKKEINKVKTSIENYQTNFRQRLRKYQAQKTDSKHLMALRALHYLNASMITKRKNKET